MLKDLRRRTTAATATATTATKSQVSDKIRGHESAKQVAQARASSKAPAASKTPSRDNQTPDARPKNRVRPTVAIAPQRVNLTPNHSNQLQSMAKEPSSLGSSRIPKVTARATKALTLSRDKSSKERGKQPPEVVGQLSGKSQLASDGKSSDLKTESQDNNGAERPARAKVYEKLRLQVYDVFGGVNNEKLRSVSLPNSPRIERRAQGDHQAFVWQNQANNCKQHRGKPIELITNHQLTANKRQVNGTSVVSNGSDLPTSEQLLSVCDQHNSHDNVSMASESSSSSSFGHTPVAPMLTLSCHQLHLLKLGELMRSRVNLTVKRKRNNNHHRHHDAHQDTMSGKKSISAEDKTIGSRDNSPATQANNRMLNRRLAALTTRRQTSHNKQTLDDDQKKIDHDIGHSCASRQIDGQRPELDEDRGAGQAHSRSRIQVEDFGDLGIRIEPPTPPNDQQKPASRRQQTRSNSIGGQDFRLNGGYQRLKQSLQYVQPYDCYQGPFSAAGARAHPLLSPYQQQQTPAQLPGRSPSPMSNCQQPSGYGLAQRPEAGAKFAIERQTRNQLHASLECLNTTSYTDYHPMVRQQELVQQQRPGTQQQQQQQQHYAAGFLHQPLDQNNSMDPSITVKNGSHPGHSQLTVRAASISGPSLDLGNNQVGSGVGSGHQSPFGTYGYQTQNLINRAMAQVGQSPIRRLGLGGGCGQPTTNSSAILSQISAANPMSHPMRAGHSSLSLASSSFLVEDKLHNEIRKLQSELKTEREKNDALNSQLNINSTLMTAFEQSLTTLNTRLRQLTTLNEKKDKEIEELKEQATHLTEQLSNRNSDSNNTNSGRLDESLDDRQQRAELTRSPASDQHADDRWSPAAKLVSDDERLALQRTIEELRRQLIEKDRLLTDTRLEALSAAHQLEQLESKLNGEHHSILGQQQEDELDEGVMVVNLSPSDSDAVTDSAHFSEINSQISRSPNNNLISHQFTANQINHHHHHQQQQQHNDYHNDYNNDTISFSSRNVSAGDNSSSGVSGSYREGSLLMGDLISSCNSNNNNVSPTSNNNNGNNSNNSDDQQSNHSSDYQLDRKDADDCQLGGSTKTDQQQQQSEAMNSGDICKLMDNLLK